MSACVFLQAEASIGALYLAGQILFSLEKKTFPDHSEAKILIYYKSSLYVCLYSPLHLHDFSLKGFFILVTLFFSRNCSCSRSVLTELYCIKKKNQKKFKNRKVKETLTVKSTRFFRIRFNRRGINHSKRSLRHVIISDTRCDVSDDVCIEVSFAWMDEKANFYVAFIYLLFF